MKRSILTVLVLLSVSSSCMAGESELTGVFKRTTKALSPYTLELDGATGSFHLRGNVLKDVPDGTRIWVKGNIDTLLHDNRNDPAPAMPSQWHVYMNVQEYEEIRGAFERPKQLTPDPVLVDLKGRIEQEFAELDSRPTFEIPESSEGRSLVVRFKTRQYVIHPRTKGGRISEQTVTQEGPSDDGFLLRAHVQPLGEVNQADVPQTIRQTYWSLYLQVFGIEEQKKQIYFALSYNSRTKPELIKQLKDIAEQCGAP